ncbi:MAG: hypothetical protein DWQ37_12445 [Planctomycetota bacterium]|nr:MAG: hypothetical protein DWQ37_12445 [Planctomycetota bacterium]
MAVPTESASRPANAPAPPPAERGDAEPRMRKLSRAEKIQRRQVRNIALMIFGVIVLAIAVVVLGRL